MGKSTPSVCQRLSSPVFFTSIPLHVLILYLSVVYKISVVYNLRLMITWNNFSKPLHLILTMLGLWLRIQILKIWPIKGIDPPSSSLCPGLRNRQQDLRLILPLLRHQVRPGGNQEGTQASPRLPRSLQMWARQKVCSESHESRHVAELQLCTDL